MPYKDKEKQKAAGGLAEWPNAVVLKTTSPQGLKCSNHLPSAKTKDLDYPDGLCQYCSQTEDECNCWVAGGPWLHKNSKIAQR